MLLKTDNLLKQHTATAAIQCGLNLCSELHEKPAGGPGHQLVISHDPSLLESRGENSHARSDTDEKYGEVNTLAEAIHHSPPIEV